MARVCHRAWGIDIPRPWRTKVGELKEVLERTLGVQPHRLTLTKASRYLENEWTLKTVFDLPDAGDCLMDLVVEEPEGARRSLAVPLAPTLHSPPESRSQEELGGARRSPKT